jgi:hypothetical protein
MSALVWIAAAGLLASPDAPRSTPIAEAITVEPGSTCLSEERLIAAISRLIGISATDKRIGVAVVGDPIDPLKVEFEVVIDEASVTRRSFDPAPRDCEQLHTVVAVAIGLAIDAAVQPPAPPSRSISLDLTRVGPPLRASTVGAPRSPSLSAHSWSGAGHKRAWNLDVWALPMLGIRLPGAVGGGGKIGLGWVWSDLVEVGASALTLASGRESAHGGEARFVAVAGALNLCVGPRLRILRPRGCAALIAGGVFAKTDGFVDDGEAWVAWVAVAVGGDLGIALSKRVELRLAADLLLNGVRPAFGVVTRNGVSQTLRAFPIVAGALSLGVSVRAW